MGLLLLPFKLLGVLIKVVFVLVIGVLKFTLGFVFIALVLAALVVFGLMHLIF
jgi:hypothetical protein